MWLRAWLCLALGIGGAAHAASFDCTKAKRKIEKRICADAALSQLDDQAARAYAQAYASASLHHQQELIAERAKFRRERGRYDASPSALADDYQTWLFYLTHPQRARIGMYQGSQQAYVRVLPMRAARGAALLAQGASEASGSETSGMGWVSAAPFFVESERAVIEVRKATSPETTCPATLHFDGEQVRLRTQGKCAGNAIDAAYRKVIPNLPIWVMPRGSVPLP